MSRNVNEFSMDFFSLKGKVAVVTGGNTGLGQGYAVALAKAGADIFVPTYDTNWEETRKLVEAEGRKVAFFQCSRLCPHKVLHGFSIWSRGLFLTIHPKFLLFY